MGSMESYLTSLLALSLFLDAIADYFVDVNHLEYSLSFVQQSAFIIKIMKHPSYQWNNRSLPIIGCYALILLMSFICVYDYASYKFELYDVCLSLLMR